jgi:hypothetical protein
MVDSMSVPFRLKCFQARASVRCSQGQQRSSACRLESQWLPERTTGSQRWLAQVSPLWDVALMLEVLLVASVLPRILLLRSTP